MTKATVVAKATEMIISGFVSKGDNNLVDFGWEKIKKAHNERKSCEQNIETRIYQVTVDAINTFTFNEHKEKDTLYIAAENILRGFKSGRENIEAVKMGLKMLESQITDDRCADFLGTLCDEICKDKNDNLYKEIILIQNEQINEDVDKGFKRSEQNQEYIREDIHKGFERSEQNNQETQRKLDYLVEKADDKEANSYNETRVENRAKEYAEKWNKNVFLNDFNKRDKNAGVNVKLKDIYLEEQLPHYTWKMDDESSSDLKELLREYTVDNDRKNMLLILGQPGIGKSTLITWIMANFEEKKDDFLVYQFASDLKCVNWQGDNILSQILRILNLKYNELENKVLILDGFDEIYANSDRERILNKLNQELAGMNFLNNFSIIITCRVNYVYELGIIECEYVTLQTWDDVQIKSFCEIYEQKCGREMSETKIDKILKKKTVFGIPLILYMVLALEITIEKSESLVNVYDQIFSVDRSSMYDRCIKNSRYGKEHRISENKIKQQIYQISQRIAYWIFENNSEKAFISQKEYEKICENVISEISEENVDIKRDLLIGNYFKLIKNHEGIETQELYFIHRSIYEYFVVIYFYDSLRYLKSKEEVAGKLGELLKDGYLSEQILQFIKYKFDGIEGYNLSDITRETFQVMLRDGMTYHAKGKYKNIMVREINIFANMLEVVHLWNPRLRELDNKIVCYLQHNHLTRLNLRETDLRGIYLRGANLRRADLRGADLRRADLRRTDLRGADLRGADLKEVHLEEADLSEADLRGADLRGVYLRRTDLRRVDLSGVDLSGADLKEVYLGEADLKETLLVGTDLRGADLSKTDLRGSKLNKTDLKGADLSKAIFDEKQIDLLHEKSELSSSKVFIWETNEIIDYKDYYIRKQNN